MVPPPPAMSKFRMQPIWSLGSPPSMWLREKVRMPLGQVVEVAYLGPDFFDRGVDDRADEYFRHDCSPQRASNLLIAAKPTTKKLSPMSSAVTCGGPDVTSNTAHHSANVLPPMVIGVKRMPAM